MPFPLPTVGDFDDSEIVVSTAVAPSAADGVIHLPGGGVRERFAATDLYEAFFPPSD